MPKKIESKTVKAEKPRVKKQKSLPSKTRKVSVSSKNSEPITRKGSVKKTTPIFSMETIDGRELRVARWVNSKSNKTPILFFNGIGANIEAIAPFAEMLSDRDFITFDMPGVGGSPDPVVPYNAIMMARIANILLDRFGVDLVDVMGVSWGGAMAQQFALQYSGRIKNLILIATSAGMIMMPGNPKALVKMADPRRYIDPEFMRKHFNTLYGGGNAGSDGHISRITPPSKMGYFYQLGAMLGWTSAPFLPFMKIPTLIMMGGDDQIVPLSNGQFLKFLIPNSELFVIEEGGHLFMLNYADESVAKIKSFLDNENIEKAAA